MRPFVASRWSLVAGIVLLLFVLVAEGTKAQAGKPTSAARPDRTPAAQAAPSSADQAEIDALKSDLLRMNSILNQLRTNLGYVSTTTQPLRHQFELEIEMWQIEIGQTQRRLDRLEAMAKR